jgi:hypothetical protein
MNRRSDNGGAEWTATQVFISAVVVSATCGLSIVARAQDPGVPTKLSPSAGNPLASAPVVVLSAPPLPAMAPAPTLPAATPSPAPSDFTLEGTSLNLKLEYRMVRIPGTTGFQVQSCELRDPLPDQMIITWKTTSGIAPQRIGVAFQMTFKNDRIHRDLTTVAAPGAPAVPVVIIGNNGRYVITRQMLEDFAVNFDRSIDRIVDRVDASSPIQKLEPVSVIVKPTAPGGFTTVRDGIAASNTFTISIEQVDR